MNESKRTIETGELEKLTSLPQPPILGKFCHSDKIILFNGMKQAFCREMSKFNHLWKAKRTCSSQSFINWG